MLQPLILFQREIWAWNPRSPTGDAGAVGKNQSLPGILTSKLEPTLYGYLFYLTLHSQDEILSLNNQLTESCKSLDALTAQHQALMVNCAGLTEELESKKEALEGKDKHMDELHQRLDGLNR